MQKQSFGRLFKEKKPAIDELLLSEGIYSNELKTKMP